MIHEFASRRTQAVSTAREPRRSQSSIPNSQFAPAPSHRMRAEFRKESPQMAIRKVGVLGCGLMGSGIAQVAAQAGYDVVVREVEQKYLDKGIGGIQKNLGRSVEKGKMQQADADACLGRLKGTTSLDDLADCDIVIEAIIENAQLKKETYAALDKIVKPEAIFASNKIGRAHV